MDATVGVKELGLIYMKVQYFYNLLVSMIVKLEKSCYQLYEAVTRLIPCACACCMNCNLLITIVKIEVIIYQHNRKNNTSNDIK